jgi:hypothetical protein
MDQLAEHGRFSIDVRGTILRASLEGCWNIQTARAFSEEFKLKAQPLIGKPWGHLVLLEDWDLGVPEIQVTIEELVAWCIEQDLTRAAHVYSTSMLKQYHLNKLVLEKMGNFHRNSFSDVNSAIAWLSAEGFELSADSPS